MQEQKANMFDSVYQPQDASTQPSTSAVPMTSNESFNPQNVINGNFVINQQLLQQSSMQTRNQSNVQQNPTPIQPQKICILIPKEWQRFLPYCKYKLLNLEKPQATNSASSLATHPNTPNISYQDQRILTTPTTVTTAIIKQQSVLNRGLVKNSKSTLIQPENLVPQEENKSQMTILLNQTRADTIAIASTASKISANPQNYDSSVIAAEEKQKNSDNTHSDESDSNDIEVVAVINAKNKSQQRLQTCIKSEQAAQKHETSTSRNHQDSYESTTNDINVPTEPVDDFTPINFGEELLEAVANNVSKPNFNCTMRRTFGHTFNLLCTAHKTIQNAKRIKVDSENNTNSKQCMDVLEGEIMKFGSQFSIKMDPLLHEESEAITLICRSDHLDLPCLPPVTIRIPSDYPNTSACYDADNIEEYTASPFLKLIHDVFIANVSKFKGFYSLTKLLSIWELSARQAIEMTRSQKLPVAATDMCSQCYQDIF